MSLASLPKPAIELIFRFISHPCADAIRFKFMKHPCAGMIKDAFELDEWPVMYCGTCDADFRRYDRGLWVRRDLLLCADCLVDFLAEQSASRSFIEAALAELEGPYPGGLRHVRAAAARPLRS